MPHLDPDDFTVIEEAKAAGAVLVTWDSVMRGFAGGMTPLEALEMGENEAEVLDRPEAKEELGRLRTLSPLDLTRLSQAADSTVNYFQHHIQVTEARARVIRVLRVRHEYSWRAIARRWAVAWGEDWSSNQLAGMVICKKAARLLHEDFMKPPWN